MRYHTILFDLDGTLLNTLQDLTDSCNHAMRAMGFAEHETESVRIFINNGALKFMTAACPPGTPEADVLRSLGIFQAHYREHLAVNTHPYPGVLEVLDAVKARGIKVGVVSNKFDGAVKMLCQKYFGDRVDVAVGEHEADGVRRKPWPDMVYEALKKLDAPAEGTLYVGDSDVDIATARNAALPCLCVSWGYRARADLTRAGATWIIDRADQFMGAMDGGA